MNSKEQVIPYLEASIGEVGLDIEAIMKRVRLDHGDCPRQRNRR
jgi:hypothetical protein